jgi:hypothetical protein
MTFESYASQRERWPAEGRHILAQFDEDSIIVYQAYRSSIAQFALEHQRFGGDFRLTRMSWIKPNFLWMMYRSGWASKAGQERVLALRLKREFFDSLLARAVASSFGASGMSQREDWQTAVDTSDVRLQWDPDHDPSGAKQTRRAIQLGLRGATLREYAAEAILEVIDMTPLVLQERDKLRGPRDALLLPREEVYTVTEPATRLVLGLDRAS